MRGQSFPDNQIIVLHPERFQDAFPEEFELLKTIWCDWDAFDANGGENAVCNLIYF